LQHDLEQRRFPQTIPADDPEPLSGRQIQRDIFEQRPAAKFHSYLA
jgi:hypothetical protein